MTSAEKLAEFAFFLSPKATPKKAVNRVGNINKKVSDTTLSRLLVANLCIAGLLEPGGGGHCC